MPRSAYRLAGLVEAVEAVGLGRYPQHGAAIADRCTIHANHNRLSLSHVEIDIGVRAKIFGVNDLALPDAIGGDVKMFATDAQRRLASVIASTWSWVT